VECLRSELYSTEVGRSGHEVMIDEVVEEGGDVVVETRDVVCGEPGEDCLAGAVGTCVEGTAEILAYAQM